jgi:hypothetical protein
MNFGLTPFARAPRVIALTSESISDRSWRVIGGTGRTFRASSIRPIDRQIR